jgi:hypothetical protein
VSDRKPPPAPRGSGPSGRKLWRAVVAELDLDQHEELLLLQAVRAVDRLDLMAAELDGAPLTVRNSKGDEVAHPLLVESRQTSLMLARLVASLRLPSGLSADGGDELDRPQRRGAVRGSYGLRSVQ